jgi:hypothetical protein
VKRRNVIALSSLPTRPMGIAWTTATVWLLMDRLNAPSWMHGAVWSIWALLCVAWLVDWWFQVHRDVPGFGNDGK